MRNSKRIARFRISSCPSRALVVAGNWVQFSACAGRVRICSAFATPGKGTHTHARAKSSSVTRRSCFSATGGVLPSHTVTTWRGNSRASLVSRPVPRFWNGHWRPPTRRRSFEIAAGGRRQLGTAGPTLGFRRLGSPLDSARNRSPAARSFSYFT